MNTTNKQDLEKNVLQAARTLAAVCLHEATIARQIELLPENSRQVEEALADSELALAHADMNVAAAHVRYLTAMRVSRKEYVRDSGQVSREFVAARKHLRSVAMGGDDQAILQAAREYGEKVNAAWLQRQHNNRLSAACTEAMMACSLAVEERRNLLEKREQAIAMEAKFRADSAALYKQLHEIQRSHDVDSELVAAILVMTGMQGKASSS